MHLVKRLVAARILFVTIAFAVLLYELNKYKLNIAGRLLRVLNKV